MQGSALLVCWLANNPGRSLAEGSNVCGIVTTPTWRSHVRNMESVGLRSLLSGAAERRMMPIPRVYAKHVFVCSQCPLADGPTSVEKRI
jgi:hypothetical protein